MGVHQELYTNSEKIYTVRSGIRPDLPDFAVLGILVWAMTSQGHRTIRKWCSPALNGYFFSRQMLMAKEDGGSRRAKRRNNTSGAWKSLRVLSPFIQIGFCERFYLDIQTLRYPGENWYPHVTAYIPFKSSPMILVLFGKIKRSKS